MTEQGLPGAEDLAALFPHLYFELQCAQLQADLQDQHHLQATVTLNGTAAEAVVRLNDGFALVLTPTIPGFGGLKNWMLFKTIRDPRTRSLIKLSQYRCGIELVQDYSGKEHSTLLTFGIDAGDINELIARALEKVKEHCGLRLVALPVTQIDIAEK